MLFAQRISPDTIALSDTNAMTKSEETEVAGVRLTSPERVLYDEQGITKRGLAEYYQAIEAWIVPQVEDRPLTLLRCPQGQEKYCFIQRRVGEGFPDYIHRVIVELAERDEKEGDNVHVAVDSLPGVVYLVQIGVLEIHTWGARRDRLDRPDRMIFDLDPDPSVPFTTVMDAARQIRARLAGLGLDSFVKTTGGKGLHVVVPIARTAGWDDVHAFSRALAEEMVAREPEHFISEASKTERAGKIFIDWLRNSYGATAVAAYSTRARLGAPVSVPLAWEELVPELHPAGLTLLTVPERLRSLKRDPWHAYATTRQSLTKSVRTALGVS
jgi:bifunctional non-homologous end joining protein LigD